jgi:hypothetical protein
MSILKARILARAIEVRYRWGEGSVLALLEDYSSVPADQAVILGEFSSLFPNIPIE